MKSFKRLLIPLLFSFLFTSCEKIDLGEEVSVRIGEQYRVSMNLMFTVDSISDYRCPQNAVCIWPGDVDLYFNFGYRKELFNLNNREANPITVDGYIFEILHVLPYPKISENPGQEDFIIKLKVTAE